MRYFFWGKDKVEASEILSAMRLEEKSRAILAEANYKAHKEEKLVDLHYLEGKNLELGCVSNSRRGFVLQKEGVTIKRRGSNKLSRELKLISIQ